MQPIEQRALPLEMIQKIDDSGVIAVLIVDNAKHALPLAEALLKGGVDAIELTLRTEAAIDSAQLIRKEFPEITLGFGTVITVEQVKKVVDLGADFAVSPGCNPKIITEAYKLNLPFAPGIMTPSEIEIAIENGCRVLKFFPAETSGGLTHLKSISAPYNYLGLKFIPLGGINISNAKTYLESPLISAIGGSWIAKRDLIQSENWEKITENALQISKLISDFRN